METEENKNGKCADCVNMQTIRELEKECKRNSAVIGNLNSFIKCLEGELKKLKI